MKSWKVRLLKKESQEHVTISLMFYMHVLPSLLQSVKPVWDQYSLQWLHHYKAYFTYLFISKERCRTTVAVGKTFYNNYSRNTNLCSDIHFLQIGLVLTQRSVGWVPSVPLFYPLADLPGRSLNSGDSCSKQYYEVIN